MSWITNYDAAQRELLMQKVQMQMSERRFRHVLGVEETAVALAAKYGADEAKASIAALTHDYAKERPNDEFELIIRRDGFDLALLNYGNEIWHGLVGADIVQRELAIDDEEILQAIRVHTTGAAKMSLLDKIIYVADYIEPGRDFPGVKEAREIALVDLDAAVAYETKHTLLHLIEQEHKIYPKTLETYNQWVVNQNKRRKNYQEGTIIDSQKILEIAVKAADSKRAEEIVALDVREISLLADYFLICQANSERQINAIVDEINEQEAKNQVEVKRVEGKEGGKWILIDLGDVIVHVFQSSERAFYNLEKLWSDAPMVDLSAWVD